eukprot:1751786-Lingulodinium_polyedra.AAC.1
MPVLRRTAVTAPARHAVDIARTDGENAVVQTNVTELQHRATLDDPIGGQGEHATAEMQQMTCAKLRLLTRVPTPTGSLPGAPAHGAPSEQLLAQSSEATTALWPNDAPHWAPPPKKKNKKKNKSRTRSPMPTGSALSV